MKKTFPLLLCLSGFVLLSCSNDSFNNNSTNISVPVDIYVAGMEFSTTTTTYNKAVYWKNNQPIYLTNGTHGAKAEKIRVVGQKVYVLGIENNDAGRSVSKLWKNGWPIPFLPNEHCYAYDFWVDGNDIYAVGTTENQQIAYWKNGIQTLLVNNNDSGNNVGAIKIVNHNVYIGGYSTITHSPVYWKNGIMHQLESLENNPMIPIIEGIEVTDNDVYLIGNYPSHNTHILGQPGQAVYWKNESINILGEDIYANGLAVYDDNLYIICNDFQGSFYYKNGVRIQLSNGTTGSEIKILNGAVYACGSMYNTRTGLLWINNVQSSYNRAFANDLFIVQN